MRLLRTKPILSTLLLACLVAMSQFVGTPTQAASRPLNILFIILDDVGKDQLAVFNPASSTALLTPNINAIAAAGVKFTNFQTTPQCSPSRAAFFTGRYPLRTGVTAAILDEDLPAAHVSPFETTTPRLLSTAGYRGSGSYKSALIGKYHLGGPENNPDTDRAPLALGWHHFNGNLRGGPPSVDVTLGGQFTQNKTKYSCGFPTGSQRGAAWFQASGSAARCDENNGAGFTGQQAVAMGGIPALDSQGNFAPSCREAISTAPDFTRPNGYYVWPQVIANPSKVESQRLRQYMTTAQTDAAIEWVHGHSTGKDRDHPWMATVSYNAIHTPYQQPPTALYPPGFAWPANVPENCTDLAPQRIISDLMLAAMDQDIGRLLRSLGLARSENGRLVYQPEATDTMVVLVGDNGTFLTSVQTGYDPLRAKGTGYQTGISAPMIVAGPLVVGPGRTVDHMVNAVDLFQLFGEIAGVNVRAAIPRTRVLDAEPVLAYLTNPNQPSIRRYNYTELGLGLKPASVKLWPCVIRVGPISIATDILFTSQSICEDTNGTWFGPTAAQPTPQFPTSCSIRAAGLFPGMQIVPSRVWGLRNSRYKLVKLERASCDAALGEYELYDLTPRPPTNPFGLDLAATNLLTSGQPVGLTTEQAAIFSDLRSELDALLKTESVCHGDGNLDKRADLNDLRGIAQYWGLPSVFDFNKDGVTNNQDMPDVLNGCAAVSATVSVAPSGGGTTTAGGGTPNPPVPCMVTTPIASQVVSAVPTAAPGNSLDFYRTLYQTAASVAAAAGLANPLTVTPAQLTAGDNNYYALAAAAYIWGLPLNLFWEKQASFTSNTAAINQLYLSPRIDTSNFIVSTNTDVLYANGFLDLSRNPYAMTYPQSDAFNVLQIMDPYTNVQGSVGTRVNACGEVVLYWAQAAYAQQVKAAYPNNSIAMYSPQVWLIGRVAVDSQAVQARNGAPQTLYQNGNGSSNSPLALWRSQEVLGQYSARALTAYANSGTVSQSPAVSPATTSDMFYTYLSQAVQKNGLLVNFSGVTNGIPNATSTIFDQTAMFQTFATIGLSAGRFDTSSLTAQQRTSMSQGYAGARAALGLIANSGTTTSSTNYWSLDTSLGQYAPSYSGWIKNATVALVGLGANMAADGTYPRATVDSTNTRLTGAAGNQYQLDFSSTGTPPMAPNGFWSVTVYDANSYLYPSTANTYYFTSQVGGVYALGSIQFANDSRLPTLYFQSAPPSDAALLPYYVPVPPGPFSLQMRVYNAIPGNQAGVSTVLNPGGQSSPQWIPPAIRKR
jgi:arylsulfatase A-like enzyme